MKVLTRGTSLLAQGDDPLEPPDAARSGQQAGRRGWHGLRPAGGTTPLEPPDAIRSGQQAGRRGWHGLRPAGGTTPRHPPMPAARASKLAVAAGTADSLGRACKTLSMTNSLTATLRTNRGTVLVRLFPDHAPKTVRNFVDLAEGNREWTDPTTRRTGAAKLYDGTIFHRVIPRFMIQGGDPLGTGTGGPGYKFGDEIHPDLRFDRPYLLAMANAGPGTNGSQFFITTAPTPHLNGRHTIFGEVISGGDVVDSISNVPTGRNDRPVDDVVLESVVIERDGDTAESGNPGSGS